MRTTPGATMLRLQIHLLAVVSSAATDLLARVRPSDRDERGQATAEYALVLVAVVAIAGLLLAWARRTDLLDTAMDRVFESLTGGN